MTYCEEILKEISSLLQKKGIVTRNECPSIDSRPFGRGLVSELEKRGIVNIDYIEENINNYSDYSGALFDTNRFNHTSAAEYLRKKVLK